MTDAVTSTTPDADTAPETGRDRVRRLLVQPLTDLGFRFPKGADAAKSKAKLDRICDDLGYLTDRALIALEESLRTKGQGSARQFWPEPATVLALAEAFEPRPLSDLPALRRWFASEAGRKALEGDRLVAEFLFWERHKRPPTKPGDLAEVDRLSREQLDRAHVLRDRRRRGVPQRWPGDDEWLTWFEDRQAMVLAMVRGADVATDQAGAQ